MDGSVLRMQETRTTLRILAGRSQGLRPLRREQGVDGKAVLKWTLQK
jgi:hypothetical protein